MPVGIWLISILVLDLVKGCVMSCWPLVLEMVRDVFFDGLLGSSRVMDELVGLGEIDNPYVINNSSNIPACASQESCTSCELLHPIPLL